MGEIICQMYNGHETEEHELKTETLQKKNINQK